MAQETIGKISDTAVETGENSAAAKEKLGDYQLPGHAVAVVEAADREIEAAQDRFRPDDSRKDSEAELKEFPGRKREGDGDKEAPVREQREKTPPRRYGNVKDPPQFVRKPATEKEAEEARYVEGLKPVSHSLRENLSQDALARDPDLYSTYDVTPQPDSGRGMQAAARVFHERERARIEQAPAIDEPENGDTAAPEQKTPIWAYTHHGLDVRDFKAHLEERDAALAQNGSTASVVDRTRAVIAVDSPEKLAALQQSNLFGNWEVEYQLIDHEHPEEVELPEGTGIALFPDTLDKLPAQQILESKATNSVMQIQEATAIADTDPLVRVDPETGQAHTIPPIQVGSSNTSEGKVRYDLMPQLAGKIISDRGTWQDSQQLEGQEDSARAFMQRQPEALAEVKGTVFNWQQSLRPLVQQATAGLRDDGLMFISGPMRDTHLGEPAFQYHEKLDEMQGPIVSHVIEQSEVDAAVQSVARDAGSVAIGDRVGGYGYMFVDRSATTNEQVAEFIETELRPAFAPNAEAARLADELNKQRGSVALARSPKAKEGLAADIKDRFDELVGVYPQSGRDYALVHELAVDLNNLGDHEAAREVAERAVAAAPHFSGGWVEIAKAEFGSGNVRGAAEALDHAIQINPRNAEIYKVALDQRDVQETRKEQLLDDYHAGRISVEELRERADHLGSTRGYVGMVSEYLNVAPHLSNDTRIEWLAKITEAQERDFNIHDGDTTTFKTYVVQNLLTGELEERHLSAHDALRIIAADTALKNAEAVAALRRQEGANVGQINAAMDSFLNVYERLAPTDEDGLPLPRDEWADLPKSPEERWIYAGSMRESDEITAPSAEWHERVAGQQETELQSVEVSTEPNEFRMPERTGVEVGHIVKPDGSISREVKSIKLSLFNRHVYVSGASGTGKSEFIKTNVIENVALNSNVKTILIYMGDKDGEYDDLAARYGDNIRIQHWRPGEKDAEAVSVNLFNPGPGVGLQDHIDQLVAWWQRVYEGGDPFPQILNNALQKVYEANGWNNVTGERGELPTFDQLQGQIAAEVEKVEYQGEARNIKSYFETRNMRNAMGQMGMFLETQNGSVELDWERAIDRVDSDVLIVDLRSGFSNPEDRRNMGMAFDMKLRQAFQARGLARGEELRTLVIMDEAQQALRNASDSEPNRKKAVEAYAQGFEQDRAYGVGRVIATPTEDIHPSVIANTAVQVRFALVSGEDVEKASSSWLVRRDQHARDLSTQEVGQAMITERGNKAEPTKVQMLYDRERARPSEEEVRAAVARQPALSTIRKINAPERPYSHLEIEEAKKQAASRESAWKYSTVGAVALSHVLAHKLPTQVAPQLRAQWQAEVNRNPRIAHLTMSRIVDKVVKERIGALRKGENHIRSDVLGASILAHTVALLDGEAALSERVSPAFGFLPARIGASYRQLTAPSAGTAPNPKQLAVPLPYRIPQPVKPAQFSEYDATRGRQASENGNGRERVETQATRLEAYPASPVGYSQLAKDRAAVYAGEVWNVIFGHDGGEHLWENQRFATQGVVDELQQRALIATQLGYKVSPRYPLQTEFETGLTLPGFLRQHISSLRQQAEKEHQRA